MNNIEGVLLLIALGLSCAALIMTHGRSLLAWAVALICVAALWDDLAAIVAG